MTAPSNSDEATRAPPLKWAGGKRWLVPRLRTLREPHAERRLVEPFVGGMAVALGLAPQQALLNDLNEHLINFYGWLKRGLVATIPYVNDERVYYGHRERFNALVGSAKADTKEAAELFYYLNRTGFNGLCRFNRGGAFNVPFGRYKTITYTRDFTTYRETLRNWTLRHGDFSSLEVEPNDFIYADPPYDVEFTSYSAGGFDWEDQRRLALWLAEQNVPVVASNQATDRIVTLYQGLGFTTETVQAPRRISCNGDRTPAREVILSKGW